MSRFSALGSTPRTAGLVAQLHTRRQTATADTAARTGALGALPEDDPPFAGTVPEGERERIVSALNELLAQRLFSISLDLSGALPLIRPGAARQRVERAVDRLDDATMDVRRIAVELLISQNHR
jgi:signal transduction histidine kinase